MFTGELAEISLAEKPDRMIMFIPGLSAAKARSCANMAAKEAQKRMPKSTGYSANRIQPIWGKNFFGVWWADSYVWFQDHGISAFTMKSLAGKTIPMWIDDPTGMERLKNPKARIRTTLSGKTQVLIFRKAATIGQRITKTRKNKKTGEVETYDAPASYPGAPGRIAVREMGSPNTTKGRVAGAIARGNVGVRWRHPGLAPRMFLNLSLSYAAQSHGILPVRVYAADAGWRFHIRDYDEES